ncbi:aldo/keto reductase [Alicyclobacillaceae bacterium I2511]|nr:aldo/keto reductase [Alicyclobacillaceae bacterium I2511]
MKYRMLGRTGLKVSELCFGAMTFGREASEADSHHMLDQFIEAGGNFIDTADVYTQGVSEEIVGHWLNKKRRSDVVIATKVRFAMGEGLNDVGLTRKHIMDGVQASLHRLNTDYIDLYQVHAWDPQTPIEETLSTLNDLVRKGWVRYIGVSNFRAWQLQKAIYTSRMQGWEVMASLQPQYNLLCRATEFELLPLAEHEGLAVLPWSPLRGGWLSGKFQRGMNQPPANTRIEEAEKQGWGESWSQYNHESTWKVLDALFEVAKQIEKSPAQVALNWLLSHKAVTAPIIGARNMEQLESNLGASGWSLTPNQVAQLNEASHLPVSYPYDEASEQQQQSGRV